MNYDLRMTTVYSLTNKLTYVKDLSTSTKINADAIANLTTALRDQIIQSHDEFKKIATDILWLNVTIFGQITYLCTLGS